MNNTNKSKNDDGNLRRALADMLLESTPADGWEDRVLDAVVRRHRHRRRIMSILSVGGTAAVAAAVAVFVFLSHNSVVSPLPASFHNTEVFQHVAEVPAPVADADAMLSVADSRPSSAASATEPECEHVPRVILPETEPIGYGEPSDIDIPIGDYIDDLLAMELMRNQELLTSITD